MDLKAWLETNEMGKYWENFESNGIDEVILKGMTEEDLEKIGVESLGDRKKLIAAINRYRGGTGEGGGINLAIPCAAVGFVIGAGVIYVMADGSMSDNAKLFMVIVGGIGAAVGAVIGLAFNKKT